MAGAGDAGDAASGVEARRQRVTARLAAEAASAADEGLSAAPDDTPPAPGACELQVAASRSRLQTMLADCASELADARAAGDAREAAYHRDQVARRQRLQKSAEASAAAGVTTSATVQASRARLDELDVPQDAMTELGVQQQACADENALKVAMLTELARDITLQDEVYEKELEKESTDTRSILQFASAHMAALRDAYAEESRKIELSLEQERADFLNAQQREIDELLALRNETEVHVAEAAAERALAHQDALRTLRSDGIAECSALAKDIDDRVQAMEQELASAHASNLLKADQLGVRAHKLAEHDADNTALAQQLKRSIAKQRDTLLHNKERWAESEKALRDEHAKLKDDHTRSWTQFQQLDAKHEVLEAADARRRAEVALNDGELLAELGAKCAAVAMELQQMLTGAHIDGIAPAPDLLEEMADAVLDLVAAEEVSDAENAVTLLNSLNAAVNNQRAVLEARSAIVADITALRKAPATGTGRSAKPSTPMRV